MKVKYSYFVIFLLFLLLPGCSRNNTQARDLTFFYLETCPSCEDYKLAEEMTGNIRDLDKKPEWNGASYNVANPDNGTRLKKLLEEKALPDISRSLPLLIVGNNYYNGYETIREILNTL